MNTLNLMHPLYGHKEHTWSVKDKEATEKARQIFTDLKNLGYFIYELKKDENGQNYEEVVHNFDDIDGSFNFEDKTEENLPNVIEDSQYPSHPKVKSVTKHVVSKSVAPKLVTTDKPKTNREFGTVPPIAGG